MTVSIAGYVSDLAFAATDLQPSDRSFVLWVERGLNDIPTVRGEDIVVPHLTGRTAAARVADTMIIELKGWILANGATPDIIAGAFRTVVEALKAVFDPAAGYQTLSATLEDGSAATIQARVTALVIDEKVASHVASVDVQMESIDPYWVITPAGS